MPEIKSLTEIGELVRKKRKKDHLTQAEAAALCGIGTRFLSELENAKPTLQIEKVLKVLRGLGLAVEIAERTH